MQYLAKGAMGHIELINEEEQPMGSLDYTTWFPKRAKITVHGYDLYEITPVGFWQSEMNITKGGYPYAQLKCGWWGDVTLKFEYGASFILTTKGGWSSTDWVALDEEQNEIASIRSVFKWNKLSFDYEIDVRANKLDKEANLVFPFILVYWIRYMRIRGAAV